MRRLLLVCVGGALGTAARHLATSALPSTAAGLPAGVLLVNVSGSFLIALVLELSVATGRVSDAVRVFLTTGVLGGYTTYSSFNLDVVRLAGAGAVDVAARYLALTVGGGLGAGLLGVGAANAVVRLSGPRAARGG